MPSAACAARAGRPPRNPPVRRQLRRRLVVRRLDGLAPGSWVFASRLHAPQATCDYKRSKVAPRAKMTFVCSAQKRNLPGETVAPSAAPQPTARTPRSTETAQPTRDTHTADPRDAQRYPTLTTPHAPRTQVESTQPPQRSCSWYTAVKISTAVALGPAVSCSVCLSRQTVVRLMVRRRP